MGVYGGLEYTEDATTKLYSYPGPGADPGVPIAPAETLTVGGEKIGIYCFDPADAGLLGDQRTSDFQVLQAGRVRLTNDTVSAEWVVEGHKVDGLSVDAMMSNMKQDIATLIALRQQLKYAISEVQQKHPDDLVILAPGADTDLWPVKDNGLFWYSAGDKVNGAAQITVQYEKLDTIKRICLLNASKYLPGTKVAMGDDADMVADTLGMTQGFKYKVGQFSFTSAQTLLAGLVKLADPIVSEGGAILSRDQVGLIMLMVLNDALASTMRRHASPIGQTADKNIQRFFPKSRRDNYVTAVAKRPVSELYFKALRKQLTTKAADIAKLEWDSCDPYALDIRPTVGVMEAAFGSGENDPAQVITAIKRKGMTGESVTSPEVTRLKNAVLGVKGATLAEWIGRAALAYTDTSTSGVPADHYTSGNGNVILSLQFTPVTSGVYGAVYEFRDHEVPMTMENRDDVLKVMRTLFGAA